MERKEEAGQRRREDEAREEAETGRLLVLSHAGPLELPVDQRPRSSSARGRSERGTGPTRHCPTTWPGSLQASAAMEPIHCFEKSVMDANISGCVGDVVAKTCGEVDGAMIAGRDDVRRAFWSLGARSGPCPAGDVISLVYPAWMACPRGCPWVGGLVVLRCRPRDRRAWDGTGSLGEVGP